MKSRKFKLIQEYPPGFYNLGDIIILIEPNICKRKDGVLFRFNPLDWPEHWQEITEKPILVTEDGVEIFEQQNGVIFAVRYKSIFDIQSFPINQFKIENDYYKYFSTKESAEKWIEKNDPKYSEKDFIDFLKWLCVYPNLVNDKIIFQELIKQYKNWKNKS